MRIKKFLLTIATALGVVTVSAVAANADTVTVKSGDTLSKIANEYNTSVSSIQQLNNLENVDLIFAGEQLQVNGTQTSAATTSNQQVALTANTNVQNTQQAASTQTAPNTQNTQQAASTTSQQTTNTNTTNSNTASSNTTSSSSNSLSNLSSSEEAARAWIVARESGGNYNAQNGQYIGAYQLSSSYLNGDYSQANQDKVANSYVQSRYGSWTNAQSHWEQYGWY